MMQYITFHLKRYIISSILLLHFKHHISTQITSFFRCIEYKKEHAYCIRLDRVPNLRRCEQEEIKNYVSQHKDVGTNSIPRRFLPNNLQGQKVHSYTQT